MAKCCFALLVLSIIANATTRENFPLQEPSKLAKFVCDISEDLVKVEKNVKTIVIVKYKTDIPVQFISEVGQCMPKNVAILVMDFKKDSMLLKRFKPSLVVMITDKAERIDVVNWLLIDFDTPFDYLSKFLLVVDKLNIDRIYKMLGNFGEFGAMDVTVVHEDEGMVTTQRLNYFTKQRLRRRIVNTNDVAIKSFPDRLKDLNGYKFKVGFYLQPEIRISKEGDTKAPFLFFLDALKNIMNASYELRIFPSFDDTDQLGWALGRREIDVHLIVAPPGNPNPQINSYQEIYYCIYAPRPDKVSLIQMMLIEPFEWMIWVSFITSILITALVWRLYRDHGAADSAFYFVFGILVYFIGQSVTFHTGKRMLVVILQIYMFVTMILSCLYQGEMTSFMTTPLLERRIKTFEELGKSDLKVITDGVFKSYSKDNYPEIYQKIISTTFPTQGMTDAEKRKGKFAFVYNCQEFEIKYYHMIYEGFADHYYLVPEQTLPYYRFYDACLANPFAARWQEYMDWSFATGLDKHWNFQLSQEFSLKNELNNIEDEEIYLKLEDMAQMFIILAAGLTAGLLAFLGEVLYSYCGGLMVMRYYGRGRRVLHGIV